MATAKKETKIKKETKKAPARKTTQKTPPKTKKVEDFAVIETGGKQYLVRRGDKIKIEKIEKPKRGTVVSFDKVLLLAKGKTVKIGTPYLKTTKVKSEWVREFKGKKITSVRYKSKTRQSRKRGHRQVYTEVIIADF